jgi:ubiquinone/menaquinone biosynthesis C-methylase UbiE
MSFKQIAPNYYSRYVSVKDFVGRGKRVLNVGCGDGEYNLFLKTRFDEVIGVDVNESDLLIAREVNSRKGIKYIKCGAENLPFSDNYFDEVICVDVIEHVRDDKKALKEMNRVLKKDGKLILTVPNKNYPFSYDPINYILEGLFKRHLPIGLWGFGHLRLYKINNLVGILKNIGFKNFKIRRMLHFFCGIFEQYYLVNLIQPLTKSSALNRAGEVDKRKIEKLKKRARLKPSRFFTFIRDLIMNIDYLLFKNSKKSLGFLVYCEKV